MRAAPIEPRRLTSGVRFAGKSARRPNNCAKSRRAPNWQRPAQISTTSRAILASPRSRPPRPSKYVRHHDAWPLRRARRAAATNTGLTGFQPKLHRPFRRCFFRGRISCLPTEGVVLDAPCEAELFAACANEHSPPQWSDAAVRPRAVLGDWLRQRARPTSNVSGDQAPSRS